MRHFREPSQPRPHLPEFMPDFSTNILKRQTSEKGELFKRIHGKYLQGHNLVVSEVAFI